MGCMRAAKEQIRESKECVETQSTEDYLNIAKRIFICTRYKASDEDFKSLADNMALFEKRGRANFIKDNCKFELNTQTKQTTKARFATSMSQGVMNF